MSSEPEWISQVRAAEIAGCSQSSVAEAVSRGKIAQRPYPDRSRPSLDPVSVTQWARARHERLRDKEQRRRDRAHLRALGGRPDGEHAWLGASEAARVLGVSRNWVGSLSREERIPFTVAGKKRWYREDHLRSMVTARALERLRRDRMI